MSETSKQSYSPEALAAIRKWHAFQPTLYDGLGRPIRCGCPFCSTKTSNQDTKSR